MNDLINIISKANKKALNRERFCMFPGCKDYAINSHVYQKNGILNEISLNGHIIERKKPDLYKLKERGIVDFKKVGTNKAYSFYGFCNRHDTEIFKSIENAKELNLELPLHQALFCYRGLCQEIRRKEISIELLNQFIPDNCINNFFLKLLIKNHIKSNEKGYKNLSFFKAELENCINKNNFSTFYFETIKIPRIDLCISVPLNIEDKNNKKSSDKKLPFVTSFINTFPKDNCSYVIVGYHNDYKCFWTDNFVNRIKNGTKAQIFKELSDLISLRLEFWAMSISLFESIDKDEIEKLRKTVQETTFEYSSELKSDLDLFKHLI